MAGRSMTVTGSLRPINLYWKIDEKTLSLRLHGMSPRRLTRTTPASVEMGVFMLGTCLLTGRSLWHLPQRADAVSRHRGGVSFNTVIRRGDDLHHAVNEVNQTRPSPALD